MVAALILSFSIFFYFAYWAWPTGFLDISLSNLTLGLLLRAGLSVLLWLLVISAVYGLFIEFFGFMKARDLRQLEALLNYSKANTVTKQEEDK